MKIGVIGAGRLGICFALLCEQAGYDVLVSDIREDYVADLMEKKIKTNEPDVQDLLSQSNNFSATTSNQKVIEECDIIYTLVATPSLPSGDYDVSAVWRVVDDIIESGVKNKSFIVGCTTNPGDCEMFQDRLDEVGWETFYNPEFIAQGSIVKDLQNADMVLIGGKWGKTFDKLSELYHKIQVTKPQISLMSRTASEVVKIATNCFLTTKISYANMMGQVLTLDGMEDEIDIVLDAIGADSRVGKKYLKFGYGFGGPCLPRDNRAFAAYAKSLGVEYNLGATTDNFNEAHNKFLLDYMICKNHKSLPFYFDYVSYKRGTDILTESQQFKLCRTLLDEGYTVYINDNETILNRVKDTLYDQYYDRVKFGEPKEEVFEVDI